MKNSLSREDLRILQAEGQSQLLDFSEGVGALFEFSEEGLEEVLQFSEKVLGAVLQLPKGVQGYLAHKKQRHPRTLY